MEEEEQVPAWRGLNGRVRIRASRGGLWEHGEYSPTMCIYRELENILKNVCACVYIRGICGCRSEMLYVHILLVGEGSSTDGEISTELCLPLCCCYYTGSIRTYKC